MNGFKGNIELLTLENNNFRKVLYTAQHLQLVVINLEVGVEIGMETYENSDQFFRFESGSGICIIDDEGHQIVEGDAIVVPAGAQHNIINTGNIAFKMYTIYSPPNHQDGIVQKTKDDAEKISEVFNEKTIE